MPATHASPAALRVLLFASYAESFGAREITLELGPQATVADLRRAVLALPQAATLPRDVLVAVNHEIARPDALITAGDEIALIPPVAGG